MSTDGKGLNDGCMLIKEEKTCRNASISAERHISNIITRSPTRESYARAAKLVREAHKFILHFWKKNKLLQLLEDSAWWNVSVSQHS